MMSAPAPGSPPDAAEASTSAVTQGARDRDAVLEAARSLVRAFAEGELDTYFSCFTPGATFMFHSHPERIDSTAAYRAVWDGWVAEDGFRVVTAESCEPAVQLVGEDVAVFTHRVRTVVETREGQDTLHERESIVFVRAGDGRWLGVHEHLSVDPLDGAGFDPRG